MTYPMKDVYASVTETIITAMEGGNLPWIRPWNSACDLVPCNLSSGRQYRGINVLLLNLKAIQCGYASNRWLTFNQARALGANVRKGEHGTEVVLYKLLDVPETGKPVPTAHGEEGSKVIPLIRSFTVFNAAQVDGLPEGLIPPPREVPEWQGCEAAEGVIEASGASIQYGDSRAFYAPSMDLIQLPDRASFVSSTAFYQVALHELTHWSGAPSRCNRPLLGRAHIQSYAFEELVAELGSAFLTDHCGLPGVTQHASYIESWLQALRNDKKLIFSAASLAQKAADFVLALCPQQSPAAVADVPVLDAA